MRSTPSIERIEAKHAALAVSINEVFDVMLRRLEAAEALAISYVESPGWRLAALNKETAGAFRNWITAVKEHEAVLKKQLEAR